VLGSNVDPRTLGAMCARCPFAKNGAPNQPVLGEGPPDADGVLVGEGPGSEEAEVGRPFVGPTGRELDKSLEAAGLGRQRMFVLNATCCRPPVGGKNEKVMGEAVAACAPAFHKQLEPHAKKPRFYMGKWAWVASGERIPRGGMTKGRGFIRAQKDSTPYIATWHPTYAFFRNPFEGGAFETDLERFVRLVKGTLGPKPSRLLVHPDIGALNELIREGLQISVDVEASPEHPDRPWTGKDPTRAGLRTIGFGNVSWGVSYIWACLTESDKQRIGEALLRHTVWQNGPWYDHRMLRRYGFKIGPWDDTRDLRMALCPTSPLSLAYLASLYDDTNPWKEEDEDDDKGLVFTEDLDELCTYNAQDCVETARVWAGEGRDALAFGAWLGLQPAKPGVDEGGPQAVDGAWLQRLYGIHRRTSVICAKMHDRGIQVHQENRNKLSRELEAEFYVREAAFQEAVGAKVGVNANNMRALIFERHRKPDVPCFGLGDPYSDDGWSSDGTVAVDQPALMALACNPTTPPQLVTAIEKYWAAYAVRQARSTFVASEKVEHAIGPDGRLRPGWNSCGTDTGRKSCSEPNVQNLSKEHD
jgi:uracil-DNA glycosylase family 4